MIMKLIKTFKDNDRVYFLLEFVTGLDMFDVMRKLNILNDSDSRFYTACLITILEHLHSRDIVYRDLKPLNILLDSFGHVKLADFGLAKANVSKANPAMSFCGSPAYLAPELVRHNGGHKPVDIYAIGVTLFELLAGRLPFKSESITKLYKQISGGNIKFPHSISHNAKNLIKWLMATNPDKRPSMSQLKSHEFFEGVDWDSFYSARLPSMYRPSRELLGEFDDIREENEDKEFSTVFEVTMVHD